MKEEIISLSYLQVNNFQVIQDETKPSENLYTIAQIIFSDQKSNLPESMLTTRLKNLGGTAFLEKKLRQKFFFIYGRTKKRKREKGRFFTTLIVFLPGIITWSERLFLSTLMGTQEQH